MQLQLFFDPCPANMALLVVKSARQLLKASYRPAVESNMEARIILILVDQDKYYIVTQLATGGALFDRICERVSM